MAQTHTHRQTDGYRDLETELAQWADSVKIKKVLRTKNQRANPSSFMKRLALCFKVFMMSLLFYLYVQANY